MNYFFLSEKIKQSTAFACTEEETPTSHELIPDVKTKTHLPFELTLKKMVAGNEGLTMDENISDLKNLWLDYQPNNLAWPLLSEKMKGIVSEILTGQEGITWIEAVVKANTEKRIYYIPCFSKELDVLNESETSFVPGTSHAIVPVFSSQKIANYSMFYLPQDHWEITSSLYINELLKKAIQKEKLTGIDFEETSVI